MAQELRPRLYKDQIKPPLTIKAWNGHSVWSDIFHFRCVSQFLVVKVVDNIMATPRDPTRQCPDSTGVAWRMAEETS